jgi:hypothetical protein
LLKIKNTNKLFENDFFFFHFFFHRNSFLSIYELTLCNFQLYLGKKITSVSKSVIDQDLSDDEIKDMNNQLNERVKYYSTPIPRKRSPQLIRRRRISNIILSNTFDDGDNVPSIHNHDEEVSINNSMNESPDKTLPMSTRSQDTTLSDYNLRELMETVEASEITIVDPDILEVVSSVMGKMLKLLSRKMYLYSVGKFKPSLIDSSLCFFSKDDHLYDIDKIIKKENFDELDLNESNESTEISNSESNEYFSYLKLSISQSNKEQVFNKARKISISSEENTIMDSDERRNLNIQLKEELKNVVVLNAQLPFIKSKLIELKQSSHVEHDAYTTRVFHDDFFLTEFDVKKKQKDVSENRAHFELQQNMELLKPTSILLPKRNQEKKTQKTRKQIEKENLIKKREDRIKMMERAFASPSAKKPLINDFYKRPNIKSNLRIKLVPYDYQPQQQVISRLPQIKPAKSFQLNDTAKIERAKTAPATGPIDERQKYPRPVSTKQPWGTINHPPYGLGYQRMTDYEIKQSVNRLYSQPKKQNKQERAISCLPKTDFYQMVSQMLRVVIFILKNFV